MSQNDSYTTISFKEKTNFHSAYTIQFPNNFSGNGLTVQEWASFEMVSNENTKFYFNYFCDVDCIKFFGSKLNNPIPSEIRHPVSNVVLDKKINFCINEGIESILYYNTLIESSGILYMKVDSFFYDGLLIDFKYNNLNEVINIIKTIDKTE